MDDLWGGVCRGRYGKLSTRSVGQARGGHTGALRGVGMARRLCVIGRGALVLSKSGAFNDTPGAEEAIEGGLIADEP